MMSGVRIVAVMALSGVVLGACSKKQPPVQPQPVAPVSTQPQSQPDRPAQPTPTNDEGAAELARVRAILEQMVYFDYDEYTIRTDAMEQLAQKVPYLRANPSIRIRIEGHADERGSVEYNLALGMRRANAVRDYLAGFGLPADRFEVYSYGEDQPLVQGSNESAWSQNRRAEFRVSGLNRVMQ